MYDYVSGYHVIREIEMPEPKIKQQGDIRQKKEPEQSDRKKKRKHEMEI